MHTVSYINAKTVISAGILSLCFIKNEIEKLYRDLLSEEDIPGLRDDIVYIDNGPPTDFKNIYDRVKSLVTHPHQNPSKLLALLESSNPELRSKGLLYLTEYGHWKDFQCRHIAQTCSYRTIASLARIRDIDQRFFKLMPQLHDVEIENPLHREEVDPFQGNEPFVKEPSDDITELEKHTDSLTHLAVDTLVSDNCVQFVEGGGVAYLQLLFMRHPTDLTIHKLIACILANLSVIASLHPNIIQGGWAYVLHQWMKSDDVALYFHSSRALANLDRDWETDMRVPAVYTDGVFLGHPVYRNSDMEDHNKINADIVFIHGLQGGPFKTWRQKDEHPNDSNHHDKKRTVFWPKDWLIPDLSGSVRVLNIGFDAASSFYDKQTVRNTKCESLIETGSTLLYKLKQADIGNRPIIWAGHSMGGLLIKEMLFIAETDPKFKHFSTNTAGVIFYSTPHRGSKLASLAKYLFPLRPTQAVKDLMYGNVYLTDLHKSFLSTVLKYNIPCISFGEAEKMHLGVQVYYKIVESESADPGVGEFHEVGYNHINTCKPESKDSPVYRHTLAFIQNCVQNIQRNHPAQK